ncbi:hypothetical protein Micbo1qcDRAFT_177903 [Microdochium bolleyi]|uniref:Uncharacterized protein n=1 Tax=Microdochium bolleyi TaxID=196109 RepID=A0A136IV54_9PEZI|nr:hypothetical protein Micbo1qcDRAFT_177903 [Microdochium bolleyi]
MLAGLFSVAFLGMASLGGGADVAQERPRPPECKAVHRVMERIKEIKARPYCRYLLGMIPTTVTSTTTLAGTRTVTTRKATSTKTNYSTVNVTPCTSTTTARRVKDRQATLPVTSTNSVAAAISPMSADAPMTAADTVTKAVGTRPSFPPQLSSYKRGRIVTACSCLKIPEPATQTVTVTRFKHRVIITKNVIKTETPPPVTTTLTATKTLTHCPIPWPTGCGVEGFEWAVFPNAQGADLREDATNFKPDLYRGVTPARNGTTSSIGAVNIAQDGSVADLFGTGAYQVPSDGYVVVNMRGYIYVTVSGELYLESNYNVRAFYIWIRGTAFTYIANEAEWADPWPPEAGDSGQRAQRKQHQDRAAAATAVVGGEDRQGGSDQPGWRRHKLRIPNGDDDNLERRASGYAVTDPRVAVNTYFPIRVMALQKGPSGFSFVISPPLDENGDDEDFYDSYVGGFPSPFRRYIPARQACDAKIQGPFPPWGQGG